MHMCSSSPVFIARELAGNFKIHLKLWTRCFLSVNLEHFVLLKLHTKSLFSCTSITSTMPKRKVVSDSDKAPKKKLKSDTNVPPKTFVSKLSFDSPEQCLRSLIYPTTLEDFLAKYWEKEPHFVRRNDNEYFKEFPTKVKLEETAKKEHLEWDKDLLLSQDENGTETLGAEGRATVKNIQKYFKEKLTILLNKPHRFHVSLRCISYLKTI